MTNAVKNKSNLANRDAAKAPEKKSEGGLNIYVIGLMALGLAALVAYQIFGCSGCYQ